MIFCIAFFLGLCLTGPAVADGAQQVHLVFHAGPVSYNVTLPADGGAHQTGSELSINHIDMLDFSPYQCTFQTPGPHETSNYINYGAEPYPIWTVGMGPPQPIISVTCTGTCLPVYGECYNSQGQYVGACCNGICAATRCRPFQMPS
ncbi:hypothetical protein GQ53DRAFT_811323 [Thozetella sp. PMI_491]|nr:hypothetical protein GQ53DRAFT_811323 [Thozetella sp. PMI_491]